jgi:sugar lactone lactonase YvrE
MNEKKRRSAASLAAFLFLLVNPALTSCVQFVRTGHVSRERDVTVSVDSLAGSRLYDGMSGVENLWLDPDSNRVAACTLSGALHLLDGEKGESLSIVRTLSIDGYFLGIDRGPDGSLYAAVTDARNDGAWIKKGGHVARIADDFSSLVPVTGDFPSINGLAFAGWGDFLFATSNFNFIRPKGSIMAFSINPDGTATKPRAIVYKAGLANGLYYDRRTDRVLYSDTLETVRTLEGAVIYRKTSFKEAFDDISVDAQGRIWMTDPARPTIKIYDPKTDTLIRYRIEGFGKASSCRVRTEEGEEFIYISELIAPANPGKEKARGKRGYDGRGILRVPLSSFDK